MALQTKTFSYGSVTDKSVLNGYVLELTVTEQSTDTVGNTSKVDFVLKLRSGSLNRFTLYGLGASVSLDGKVVGSRDRYEEDQVSLGYNASVTLVSGSTTVEHNDDGSKSLAVAFSIDMKQSDYTPGPLSVTEKTMTLTAIPRASTIAASDANIGAVSTVVISRKSSAFTHTVAVKFGDISGYIDADGVFSASAAKLRTTTLAFQIPESFYEQIPNKTSGTCTLTCTTYSGAYSVGSKTATFTATAAKSKCLPTVSLSVKDVSSKGPDLTGDVSKLIRYISTARCTVSATAKNSATVKKLTVDGETVSGSYVDFSAVEKGEFTAQCTDSRGYSKSITATQMLIPYVKLTCNASAKRPNPTDGSGRLTIKGNYYNGSFGAKDNSLTVTYKIGSGSAVTVSPTVSGNAYTATVTLSDLDYTQSFIFTVTVKDALSAVTKTVTLQPGVPVFDWGKSDFAFHVPVSFQGSEMVDFIAEKGTSGIWHYRKWADGNVECWGRAEVAVPTTLNQRGSIYWSSPIKIAYPFAITNAYRYTSIANAGIVNAQITGTETTEIAFRLQCSTQELAGTEAVVFMYVKGRWK